MKPIELSLSGLNSFRAEQLVDFAALSAAGIFGIFGPTGSGKSTILDAMTLALYGAVERAPKNIQGILNQLEDRLSVAFTFELSGAETHRYRAERSYKRVKGGGLRAAVCRLLKVKDGKLTVIAEKERDVTLAVERLLGLSLEDFTRAVVLPQGKFARFLTLKGSERRAMLQRLFHLEQYGDALNGRLKRHVERLNGELSVMAAKQEGLGDVSEQKLATLRKACAALSLLLEKQRRTLERAQQEAAEQTEVADLQREKAEQSAAWAKLDGQRVEIEAQRRALDRDQAAEHLLPYLDALEKADDEKEQALREYSAYDEQSRLAREAQQAAARRLEELENQARRLLPDFQTDKERLRAGIDLQQRLGRLVQERSSCSELVRTAAAHVQQLADRRAALDRQSDELSRRLAALSADTQRLTPPPELRERLQLASGIKLKIEAADEQITRCRADWRACERDVRTAEEQRAQCDEATRHERDTMRRLLDHYASIYDRLAATGQRAALAIKELELYRMRAGQQQEALLRQRLAAELAATLEEGCPCPVCGSYHHPQPAFSRGGTVKNQTERLAETDAAVRELTAVSQTAEQYTHQMESQALHFFSACGESEAGTLSGARHAESPPEQAAMQPDTGNQMALKTARQDMLAAEEKLTQSERRLNALHLRRGKLEERLSVLRERQRTLAGRAAEAKGERDRLAGAWPPGAPSIEHVSEAYRQLQNSDRQLALVRRALQQAQQSFTQLSQEHVAVQNEWTFAVSGHSSASGRLESAEAACASCADELHALGFGSSDPLDERLKNVIAAEADVQDRLKRADRETRQTHEAAIRLQRALESSEARRQRALSGSAAADAAWRQRLGASVFDKRTAVRAARLAEQDRQSMNARVETFDDAAAAVGTALVAITARLGDRRVSTEVLEGNRKRIKQLQTDIRELTEQNGARTQALADLKERMAAFQQIDQEKKRIEKQAGAFEKLQRVFRGNAFVEYVAARQLRQVCIAASARLDRLTHGRYALELESENAGGFAIRDDGNGGACRAVSSLSGGETFLVSLALALSLSEQIQLSGSVPLQFFFLDEGFGTLDPQLLDTVVTALEKLHMHRLTIGVISHVPELRERLPRRLIVDPAEPSGKGSRIHLDIL
ncbi:MAG: SMC family ATPase [Sporolactobacillus sp.]